MNSQPPGRILALDYGKRRIGLAVSDELGITAQGLDTFHRDRLRGDLDGLAKIAEERGAVEIVVGDPKHLSGKKSRSSIDAREFAAKLEKRTGLPVTLWDERLTTVEAQRVLKESGISSKKRAGAVDRLSAVLILDGYLEWKRINQQSGEPTA
jgi:putative pre-16S rRNA nuclease